MDERSTEFRELNTELILGFDQDITDNLGLNIFAGGNQLRNKRETLGVEGSNFSVPFLHTIKNLANQSSYLRV